MTRVFALAVLAVGASVVFPARVWAQKVYWSDVTSLHRVNPDGSAFEFLHGGFEDLPYVAVDPMAGSLYYSYGSPTPKDR